MPDNTVSSPTFSALNFITPFLFTLAPVTKSPLFFETGMLSPVNIDSSTLVLPSITIPSTGIFPPGLTITISPFLTFSIATAFSFPFSSTIKAVFGARPISFFIASPVLAFDLASRFLPNITSVIIIATDSKYIL